MKREIPSRYITSHLWLNNEHTLLAHIPPNLLDVGVFAVVTRVDLVVVSSLVVPFVVLFLSWS